jgi:RND superfamily putative drug exporter
VADSGVRSTSAGFAGDTPTAAFIVDQTTDDLQRLALAALGANLLMLILFLRAVVAALYLLVGSILSLGAALGLTMLVFGQLEPGAGLTFYVPFAAAVLLLAFGSDYNIFAVGSVWERARRHPLRESVRSVMPSTIVAIFVAGLALAASFGILAVVPLVPFRQLAFVMFVGIMFDVLIVRALLLPALLTVFGPVSAWPSKQLASERKAAAGGA